MNRDRWSRALAATSDLTPRRENAMRAALLAGYTVEECCTAITNTNAAYGPGVDWRVIDLPHILHPDRIDAAIAGDFGDDWHELLDAHDFPPHRNTDPNGVVT